MKQHQHKEDHHQKGAHHHDHGGHSGHDHTEHHKHMLEDFKKKFWVSLVLSVPVLVLAPMIQDLLGYELVFKGADYILAGLSTVIFFYGGFPFLKGLYDEVKKGSPGMMTLIAIAITVAWSYSVAVTLGVEGKTFFWELATLIVIMLLGHWVEMKSVLGASKALEKLAQLLPDTAHLVDDDGNLQEVKVSELKSGNIIQIRPGEKIPADGVIKDGKSNVNESMLTGESKPASRKPGDEVIGGSINQQGTLKVEISHTGDDAYLSKVINMVKSAQETKSKSQHLADRAAFWLTIVSLGVGVSTLAAWLLFTDLPFVFALERMVTVMVISCPHALGLAIPLVAAISTAVSAKNGLLIRNRTAFENSRNIDVVVFDKTGTLTTGEFGVSTIKSLNEKWDEKSILKLAAALESNSEHPIASGILKKAKEENIGFSPASDYENITGQGIKAKADGQQVIIAGKGYLQKEGVSIPEKEEHSGADTVVYILVEGDLIGYIALSDIVREDSAEAIKKLQHSGIKVYMLTGDAEDVAKSVSDALNMDGYFAEVLPEEKQDKVKELQSQGYTVAMTGDGVNDAPALAQADIGIAIGSGTDVAAETADIVLVNSNPKDVTRLILFGRSTYQKMVQNLIWATAYNVIAIPLAAGVLYKWGIMISPAIGAVIMSLSTVIVAINAQLLKGTLQKR